MQFTSTPNDWASLYEPLVYCFGDDKEPRDLTVEVVDYPTLKPLFTKKIYQSSSGRIDIAPLLQRHLKWNPATTPIGFSSAADRVLQVMVRVEEAGCVRHFLPQLEKPIAPLIQSTMPLRRTIRRGEREELLVGKGVLRAELELFSAGGSTVRTFGSAYSSGAALFGLDTSSVNADVQRLELRLYNGSGTETTLHYTLVEESSDGIRLAWVGRGGSIEHYTFPLVEQQFEKQHKAWIDSPDGSSHPVSIDYEAWWQIRSAFELHDTLKALVEIGTAQHVWRVEEDGSYHEVWVRAEEHVFRRHGALCSLQFSLHNLSKQLSLWS